MKARLLALLLLLPGLLQAATITGVKPVAGSWTFNGSHALAQGMIAGYIAECAGAGGEDENIVTGSPIGAAAMTGGGLTCSAEDAVHRNVFACGTSSEASVPDHPLLDGDSQSAMSVYVLAKPDSTSVTYAEYLVTKDGSSPRSWWIARKTNHNSTTSWMSQGQTRSQTEVTDGLLNPVWTSVAAAIDVSGAGDVGDGHAIEDGQPIGSDTGDNTLTDLAGSSHDMVICSRNGGSAFLGKISTVYIYDRKLTALEVEQLHTDPWAMLTTAGTGPSPEILRRRRQ